MVGFLDGKLTVQGAKCGDDTLVIVACNGNAED
jgi:hypothetical protein